MKKNQPKKLVLGKETLLSLDRLGEIQEIQGAGLTGTAYCPSEGRACFTFRTRTCVYEV